MTTFLNIILLLVGFVLLIKGADYFVEGSSSVARLLKVPSIIIGLTIVAMGTSAPELAVSISAAIKGENALAVSNIIGSNIFNLIVVLGACAFIKNMPVNRDILKREFPFLIAISAVFLFITVDMIIPWSKFNSYTSDGYKMGGSLGRVDGLILLVLFAVFMGFTIKSALKARKNNAKIPDNGVKALSPIISIIFIIGGAFGIVAGGNIVVDNAKDLALTFGMSQNLVGLTIVAIGTSLPELVTSVVASKKGENGLAIGNVVGSNIFNILLILGVSGVISPIAINMLSIIDIIIMLALTIIVFIIANTKKSISRVEGLAMILIYVAYTAYIIIR